MIYYEDKQYNFFELFNEENGTLIRSNIIGTQNEAEIECYQNAIHSEKENMSLKDYESILAQSKNKVFQVALGGAGDPNKHECFGEILSLTRSYGIISNLTTSGYNMSDNEVHCMKKFCGAVAVSYYSRLGKGGEELNSVTVNAIRKLVNAGCVTNIHYVVSDSTIDEVIYRMENNLWPSGISAVIFILYKPVGLGRTEKVVKKDQRLQYFLDLALKRKHPFRVGFDTCFTSALVQYNNYIGMASVDSCEAAKFSMYIDCEMNAYPCSFDNQSGIYKVSLRNKKIIDAWNSMEFEQFRNEEREVCTGCSKRKLCGGGCKLELGIELC